MEYFAKKDNLALVGTADPTRGKAPYDNKSFEVWAVAVAATYPDVTRFDLLFEMHPDGYWKKDPNVRERLSNTKQPLYMIEKQDDMPSSMTFPIAETDKYRRYYTSSIAYMLAWAYHSYMATGKPSNVEIYGIHMSSSEEYASQLPCCEYWIGRMESAGISVKPPDGGALLISETGAYGYEQYNPVCWDLRQRTMGLANGVKNAESEIERWRMQKARNEGAEAECEHWLRRFQRGEV